jgi:hypothetical protein
MRRENVMNFKNGALIALAAGSLFVVACKKKEDKMAADKPMTTDMKSDMKSDDMKGEMKSDDKAMAAPSMAGEKMAATKVHCSGVNACKGHGSCKGEANACAGKNGCSGKGWVELTEDECKAKNGTVLATK